MPKAGQPLLASRVGTWKYMLGAKANSSLPAKNLPMAIIMQKRVGDV